MVCRFSTKKSISIVMVLMAMLLVSCAANEQMDSNTNADTPSTGEVKTFVLTGENFKFMMDGNLGPEMRVQLGDTVVVQFSSTEGFHDWVVDELSAATEKVRAGNSTSVTFVANQKGTFEYYCSVGSHRAQGMKGNLVVE
ncbi:MAG: plastocyanin/azurin family copper-binding protein [Nanoarchaeota archaeon]|nr:plastocyanin/azurin family copper-binding protein [Nanoarchaeota archaeon]